MGFAFNPFTGNFDLTGSGGGGASYIDGEVAAYTDLPLQSNAIVSGLSATQFNGTYLYDGQVNGRPSYALNPNTRLSWDSQWQFEADGDVATSSSDVANPWLATGWVMDSLDPTGLVITESNPAPLNTAWLVRTASGVWPVSRKQAGIYIRTATGGSSRDADYTYAGTMPDVFSDANFTVYDDADSTKNLQFQLSGLTTATTSTLTVPPSGTIARTEDFAAPPAIGSTTPNSGAFSTLSVGATNPDITVFQLGNRANNTLTAYGTTYGSQRLEVGFDHGLNINNNNGYLSFNHNEDVILRRDDANVLAQRNGSNPQTFRLYNTFTSATNFERLNLRWASNVAIIGTEKLGTGAARALEFQTDGVTRMTIGSAGAVTMSDNNTMVFRTSATKFTTLSTNATGGGLTLTLTSDLNAQNAAYGIFVAGGPLRVTGADGFGASIRASGRISCGSVIQCTQIGSVQDGNQGWTFAAAMTASSSVTSVTVPFLRLAGATNLFPALKRSSTTLQVRLADDTAFAPLECAGLTLNGDLTASTRNIVTDTTTGTKIGTATDQKLGFFNATPVVQQAAVADATDAATVITQLNALLLRMRDLGLIAT